MQTFENFDLKKELEVRNRKVFGMIPIARKPDNSWISIPIVMAIGMGRRTSNSRRGMRTWRRIRRFRRYYQNVSTAGN